MASPFFINGQEILALFTARPLILQRICGVLNHPAQSCLLQRARQHVPALLGLSSLNIMFRESLSVSLETLTPVLGLWVTWSQVQLQ